MAPVVNAEPTDEVVMCGDAIPVLPNVIFTDNCDEFTVDFSEVTVVNGPGTDDYQIVRTWVATDAAGNQTMVDQTVTVMDGTNPSIVCPGSQALEVDGNCNAQLPDYTSNGNTNATDNCDDDVAVTQSPNPGTIVSVGTTTVTLTATDDAGNTETCTFDVVVTDELAPVALCNDITVALDAAGAATIAEDAVNNGSYDNCNPIMTLDTDVTDFTCAEVGNNVVTLTATDASGVSATCTANVLVEDNIAPTFTCPGAQTVTSCNGVMPDLVALVTDAADACGIASTVQTPVAGTDPGDLNGNAINAVVTVTDVNGNATSCTVTVTVDDGADPVFTNCPTTMVMVANDVDECSGKVNWSIPVAMDDCFVIDVVQTAGPASGTVVPVGAAQTITYTATDSDGNTATCSFEVMVIDSQDPAYDADIVMPADATVECSDIPAPFVLTNADVNDNCTAPADLVIAFTEVSTQGSDNTVCGPDGFYNYTITRTWTITDEAGNVTTHVQTLTVVDTTAPIAICQDVTIVLGLDGMASITTADVDNGSNDNCAPASVLAFSLDNMDFDCNDVGTNPVVLTVTDPCLNAQTCNAVITVEENPLVGCAPVYDADGSDPCSCKNNATNLLDGQFDELITIIAPAGDTWNIISNTGLFDASSAAPPAAPTPLSATALTANGLTDGIDNDGDGVIDNAEEAIYYTLAGIHVDAIGYTLEVQSANFGTTFTFTNQCNYPTIDFANVPNEVCLGTSLTLELTEQFGGTGITQFFVNGTPLAGNVFDGTDFGLGMHTITATFDADEAAAFSSFTTGGVTTFPNAQTAEEAQADPGCISEISTTINIVSTPSQVSCNDLINVSIGADCDTEITPDMALEGTYGCFDDYTVTLFESSGIALSTGNIVNASHIGETITFNLSHPISGNVCWGEVLVEDKLAPTITCPADVTIACTVDVDNLTVTGSPVVTDCSDFTVDYYDAVTDNGACAEPFTMSIVRTFVAVDAFGRADSCQQTILVQRPDLADVLFPADVAFSCEQVAQYPGLIVGNPYTLGVLADHTDFPGIMDATGVTSNSALANTGSGEPTIDGLPIQGAGSCMLAVLESDELYDVCGASYEILRTWKVRDMCAPLGPNNPREMVQIIKVLDEVGPVIDAGSNITVSANIAGTDQEACTASFNLPVASINDACSDVVSIETIHPFGTNEENGGFIEGLAIGTYNITYVAEDACGNTSSQTITVTVIDDVDPTPVCDEITQVAIGADGTATVLAMTFDDGSTDNCGIESVAVRRMTDACNISGNTAFGPDVKFCCADIGTNTMVEFQVTDFYGNTNQCMIEVLVEDKLAPYKTQDVADDAILCDDYFVNYAPALDIAEANGDLNPLVLSAAFGNVSYDDNCEAIVTTGWSRDVNSCGNGTITRTWNVVDASGNVGETCSQTITVSHVNDWNIQFPADQTVVCVAGEDEVASVNFGEPTVFDDDCELIAISLEDEIFNVVPDACYRVIRTYTAINWCVYDGDNQDDDTLIGTRRFSDGSDGIITYTQDVTVQDDAAPIITNPGTQDYCIDGDTDNGDCTRNIELPEALVSDCSDNVTITYTVAGLGTGPNHNNVAPGTYEATVTAIDNCGNQSTITYDIVVRDCKAPTPYCVGGLVVELMPMGNGEGMVELWASDFNAGSFDNCTAQDDLTILASLSAADIEGATANITFDCSNVGPNGVYLYIQDAAGNFDYCLTTVFIESVPNACDEEPNESPVISGVLATENGAPLATASVSLNNGANTTSNDEGEYALTAEIGTDVTVIPEHDVYDNTSVTTIDLVIIRQHILTTTLLDSPYKMIAADVNGNGSITAVDLVMARQMILGMATSYPNNTAWVFVDANHEFPTDWILSDGYPPVVNINNIAESHDNVDFVAVRVGDVNGTYGFADSADERNSMIINANDATLVAGQEVTVEFTAAQAVLGYQFTLNFEDLKVVSIDGERENFGVFENAITTSFADDKTSDKLFSVTFEATADVTVSEAIKLTSNITKAEAYSEVGTMNIALEFAGTDNADFALYQNTPNPFKGQTVIGFNLPTASAATLTISDISGKVLSITNGEYAKGYNEVRISDLSATGVLYYQLDTQNESATRKMIIIE